MQQTKFGKMYLDHDSVVEYSEDEIVEADRITLGYKKRLSMIENQMQHLLEDFSLDVQQIEPILADLQKYYDAFLQLLQKRNKSLQCKRSTHQPVPSPMNSQTSTKCNVQKVRRKNILRILQNKIEFEHYFQIDKGKKQKVLILAVYQCLNDNTIRTILGKQVARIVFRTILKLVLLAHRQDVPILETSKMIVRYRIYFPVIVLQRSYSILSAFPGTPSVAKYQNFFD
nr:AEL_HP1_G0051650.mRNA.1.CDS.1 [Saccharomyces cerevisiae]